MSAADWDITHVKWTARDLRRNITFSVMLALVIAVCVGASVYVMFLTAKPLADAMSLRSNLPAMALLSLGVLLAVIVILGSVVSILRSLRRLKRLQKMRRRVPAHRVTANT